MNYNFALEKALLFSGLNKLFVTREEYIAAAMQVLEPGSFFWSAPPTYKEETAKIAAEIKAINKLPITVDFSSPDLPQGSVAYHSVRGMITSSSQYWFSSKQMQQDLLRAEENQNISAHFLHISSGGGEAWYLEELAQTIFDLEKPVIALVERVAASAAYYIASQADEIYALTQNDIIGCVGTMISFWDIEPYFEKMGFKSIVAKATRSDLKNKKEDELRKGNAEQYISDVLDPLQVQFEQAIRRGRSGLNKLDNEHPFFRGETYLTPKAIEISSIDGSLAFADALLTAHQKGLIYSEKKQKQKNAHQKIYQLITS